MVSQVQPQNTPAVVYPDSDGKPMANNTKQYRWLVVIQQNLDWLFADNPNVFVAGDLFWYPVEGRNNIVNAPDVMVALGRPKGERGSYKQWEEDNIPPQVVFEILSPSNTIAEMDQKLLFYERHGVQEYYIYDPDTNHLRGFLRGEDGLEVVESLADWVSPQLGIRFDLSGTELRILYPNGDRFLSYIEIADRLQQEQRRAEQAEERLEQTTERLEQTTERLEQTEEQLEQERQRSQALAERLRAMGIDPDQI